MHFNAFWHHQMLVFQHKSGLYFLPPTFLKFMHEFRPPYFAKEAGCVLVYMEWTPLVVTIAPCLALGQYCQSDVYCMLYYACLLSVCNDVDYT